MALSAILPESFHPANPQDVAAARQSDYQQQHLPTGPTHIVSRTPQQVDANRDFLAAAGRVEFDRNEATLQGVWMAVAYFASLGDGRECYATVEHIAEKAKRSASTVRTHLRTLIHKNLIQTDNRKGGHHPTRWRVLLPGDCRAGQQNLLGRATAPVAKIRDHSRDVDTKSTAAANGRRLQVDEQPQPQRDRTRNYCEKCSNTWPKEYGPDCYECRKAKSAPKPLGGLPIYTERVSRKSAPMTAEKKADIEAQLVANGWQRPERPDGQWRRRGYA